MDKRIAIVDCVDSIGTAAHVALLHALSRADIDHVVISLVSSGIQTHDVEPANVKSIPIHKPTLNMLEPNNRASRRRALKIKQ